MVNWKHRIKLNDLRDKYDDGEITVSECGKKTAERIKKSSAVNDPEWGESFKLVAKAFERIKTEKGFNNALERLYNLGDTLLNDRWSSTKLCWVGFAF
jgi:hypothetical protein